MLKSKASFAKSNQLKHILRKEKPAGICLFAIILHNTISKNTNLLRHRRIESRQKQAWLNGLFLIGKYLNCKKRPTNILTSSDDPSKLTNWLFGSALMSQLSETWRKALLQSMTMLTII